MQKPNNNHENQNKKKEITKPSATNNQQYEDLGEVQLNQNGRPKQAVILYELTPDMINQAKQKIQSDTTYLSENRYKQAMSKSSKVWDNFYSHHKLNFFKDRNYLERQIRQISFFREKYEQDKKPFVYLQLGCGVGNTLFPLLRTYQFFNFQGCDISVQAIKLIQQQMQSHPTYKDRLQVKVCDLVKDQIPFQIKPDILSMIFVLSAIVPQKHQYVIDKIAKWMKPGSCFFFRDYGRYDFGQVNMANKGNRKLKDNFYVKQDGVCVYYFDQKQLESLFEDAGLIKVEGSIHCRLLQNRKTGLKMYRIWVQGRFYKPPIDEFFQAKIQQDRIEKEKEKKQRQQKQKELVKQLAQKQIKITENKQDESKRKEQEGRQSKGQLQKGNKKQQEQQIQKQVRQQSHEIDKQVK